MDPYEFDRRISLGLSPDSSPPLPGLFFAPLARPNPLCLAGVDEAGRGPLAGPVVASAVILPAHPVITGLNDSKKISSDHRESLYAEILSVALAVEVEVVEPDVIDSINILAAALSAMRNAVRRLKVKPDLVLVDGNQKPGCPVKEMTLIKGDGLSACVMAASIVAKVTRDRIMREIHVLYPNYGFDTHKGYGSPSHMEAIRKFGPSPVHRHTFEPIKSMRGGYDGTTASGFDWGGLGVGASEEERVPVSGLQRSDEVGRD